MSHQDFKPLLLKTVKNQPKPVHTRPDAGFFRDVKAMNETENFQVQTMGKTAAAEIVKGRLAKNWSQKDLAMHLNVQMDIVKAYENGTAIPNPALVSRIKKLLGVSFVVPKRHAVVD